MRFLFQNDEYEIPNEAGFEVMSMAATFVAFSLIQRCGPVSGSPSYATVGYVLARVAEVAFAGPASSSTLSTSFALLVFAYFRAWDEHVPLTRPRKLVSGGGLCLRGFLLILFITGLSCAGLFAAANSWKFTLEGEEKGETVTDRLNDFFSSSDWVRIKGIGGAYWEDAKRKGFTETMNEIFAFTGVGEEARYRSLLELPAEGELTTAMVKKAFRKISMKYHPDRQRGKTEEEKKQVRSVHACNSLSLPFPLFYLFIYYSNATRHTLHTG